MAVGQHDLAYVTCVGVSNVAEGWRDLRQSGGVVLDAKTGEPVATSLSMPHPPRLYQGRLWILQSGTGEFGYVDLSSGQFEAVCFLPGFARGAAFSGDYAIIGVSRPRENKTFEGLALEDRLAKEGVAPRCQIAVVNLKTGDAEHRLMFSGVVEELYDVAFIPGVRRPKLIGFQNDEIRFMVKPELRD